MLPVSSKSIASKIMALKRWKFKNWDIFMDFWTETAGRSKYLESTNEAWVVASGIPLHLRSMDLFRQIGELCGGFIGAEDGVSLSTIRIKIERGAVIPVEIPVCFREEVFPVRIEVEARSPLSLHGPKSTFFRKWKSKGSGVQLMIQAVEPEKKTGDPSSSGVADVVYGQRSPKSVVGGTKRCGECVSLADNIGMGEVGRARNDLQETDEPTFEEGAIHEVLESVLCSSKDMHVDVVGPDLSTLEANVDVVGPDLSTLEAKEKKKPKEVGLGQNLLDGPQMDFQPMVKFCFEPNMSEGPVNRVEPVTIFPEAIASPVSAPSSILPQIESLIQSIPRVNSKLVESANSQADNSGDGDLAREERDLEEEMGLKVKEVAEVIGLEMDGSRSEGVRAATRVCKEVMKRKPPRTPGSKTEREHKRLGVSGDPRSSTPLPPRRQRSVPQSKPSNEL
ncbi:hypothetical protein LINPERHAP2_LOCUS39535 [Linum perenne]